MSGKSAKRIRKQLGIDLRNANPIQKRVYRTFKKKYSKLSSLGKKVINSQKQVTQF